MTDHRPVGRVCGWKRGTERHRLLQGRQLRFRAAGAEVSLASLFPHGWCIILATSSSSSSLVGEVPLCVRACTCAGACVQLTGFWLLANWLQLIEWHQMPAALKMHSVSACACARLPDEQYAHTHTHTHTGTHSRLPQRQCNWLLWVPSSLGFRHKTL